jgi:hypothetical protein
MSCSSVALLQLFGGIYSLHFHGRKVSHARNQQEVGSKQSSLAFFSDLIARNSSFSCLLDHRDRWLKEVVHILQLHVVPYLQSHVFCPSLSKCSYNICSQTRQQLKVWSCEKYYNFIHNQMFGMEVVFLSMQRLANLKHVIVSMLCHIKGRYCQEHRHCLKTEKI